MPAIIETREMMALGWKNCFKFFFSFFESFYLFPFLTANDVILKTKYLKNCYSKMYKRQAEFGNGWAGTIRVSTCNMQFLLQEYDTILNKDSLNEKIYCKKDIKALLKCYKHWQKMMRGHPYSREVIFLWAGRSNWSGRSKAYQFKGGSIARRNAMLTHHLVKCFAKIG